MALEKFKLNEGTADNPVVLSQKHIAALVAVAQDNNVEKDVRGYGTMVQGDTIKRYQKYILDSKLPNFVLQNLTVAADVFSLTSTTGATSIKEGGVGKIIVIGIDISMLRWEVTHSISITGAVPIDRSVIENRFHFNEATGDITVDPAQENAAWNDIVTIKAYPSYDPDNYQTVTVTISAIKVDEATLTFPKTTVGKGETVQYSLTVLPVSNTKTVRYEATSNGTGTLDTGLNRYTASTANETATINAKFYVGNNYIMEHTYDITTADPEAIISIVDSYEQVVTDSDIMVTVLDSDENVVGENLKNGDKVAVTIGQSYSLVLTRPSGNANYETPIYDEVFVPTMLSNTIKIIYPNKNFGVVAVFADGQMLPYGAWNNVYLKPKTHPVTGSSLVGAGYISEDGKNNWLYTGIQISRVFSDTDPGYDLVSDDGTTIYRGSKDDYNFTYVYTTEYLIKANQAYYNALTVKESTNNIFSYVRSRYSSPLNTPNPIPLIPSSKIASLYQNNHAIISDIAKIASDMSQNSIAVYVCDIWTGWHIPCYGLSPNGGNVNTSMNSTITTICVFELPL